MKKKPYLQRGVVVNNSLPVASQNDAAMIEEVRRVLQQNNRSVELEVVADAAAGFSNLPGSGCTREHTVTLEQES